MPSFDGCQSQCQGPRVLGCGCPYRIAADRSRLGAGSPWTTTARWLERTAIATLLGRGHERQPFRSSLEKLGQRSFASHLPNDTEGTCGPRRVLFGIEYRPVYHQKVGFQPEKVEFAARFRTKSGKIRPAE